MSARPTLTALALVGGCAFAASALAQAAAGAPPAAPAPLDPKVKVFATLPTTGQPMSAAMSRGIVDGIRRTERSLVTACSAKHETPRR